MTDHPSPDAEGSHPLSGLRGRVSGLRRFAVPLLAILAFLLFRAFTADDGTHGLSTGQCIATAPSDDFRTVDCSDATSLGTVTFIARNAPTDQSSAMRICSQHGGQRAVTTASSAGGTGTVICIAGPT